MKIGEFEKSALLYIFDFERPDLVKSLDDLEYIERVQSGVGLHISFRESPSGELRVYGNDIIGERPDFPDCLRFSIAVDDIGIFYFEAFSNSGDWFPYEFKDIEFRRI